MTRSLLYTLTVIVKCDLVIVECDLVLVEFDSFFEECDSVIEECDSIHVECDSVILEFDSVIVVHYYSHLSIVAATAAVTAFHYPSSEYNNITFVNRNKVG